MKAAIICTGLMLLATSALRPQQPDIGTEAQREAGKGLYMKNCSQCHGDAGDGQGIAARFFQPSPRDFTLGQLKIRTTGSGELPTTEDIKRVIKAGMPYTGMPAWPQFSDKELTELAYFIKTFSPDFADPDYVPKKLDLPPAPKYSEESAKLGRKVFETNECIKCHGEHGRGNGESATTLKNERGESIRPADMTKRWTFRGGSTREDIYRTFTTGLNGTPMPSYRGLISPEDQWHLVDYVYSLSRSTPDYATVIISHATPDSIDLRKGRALFENIPGALFPIVGQVIEPGRDFFPGVNAIEVRAIHNANEIAFMLSWHDMSKEATGKNSPALKAPPFGAETAAAADPFADVTAAPPEENFSDAVALQIPAKVPETIAKPYFLFGDRRNPVDIWFLDLAKNAPERFTGKGAESIDSTGIKDLGAASLYDDGEWAVIFKNKRLPAEGMRFDEGTFVPVAFSVWDGFSKEHGNRRGISSWYNVYIEPLQKKSVVWPMLKYGFLTLAFELVLVLAVQRNQKKKSAGA